MVPRPEQCAGLLILSFTLPFVFALIGEGVDALVAAGVAVRVVDDDVFRGDGQMDPQLVAGQTALGLGTHRTARLAANGERYNRPEIYHHFMETENARLLHLITPCGTSFCRSFWQKTGLLHEPNIQIHLHRPGKSERMQDTRAAEPPASLLFPSDKRPKKKERYSANVAA